MDKTKNKDIEITLEKAKFGLNMWDENDYAIMLERGDNTYFPKILKHHFDPRNVSLPPPFLNNNLEIKLPIKDIVPKKRAFAMNIFGR